MIYIIVAILCYAIKDDMKNDKINQTLDNQLISDALGNFQNVDKD